MFDARIAIEETVADMTDAEVQEMNEYHDRMDREWQDRCEMADMISDLSKDVQGFRYRFNWQTMPMDQLEALYNEWIKRHSEFMAEYDAEWEQTELDLLDDEYYKSVIQDQLSTPDEWDDIYHTMGW